MKNNIRKRIIIFTLLCALVFGGVLASYAFFVTAGNNTKQEALTVNSGNIALTFNDGTSSFQGSLNFGENATKSFTIENTGSIDATARMKWDNLINTYLNGSLTYTLSYSESENGEYTEIVSNKNVPRSAEASTKLLADNLIIPVGQKYFYKLTITLNYLDNKDQTADLDAVLTANFTLEDRTNIKTYTLMARKTINYAGEFWSQAANIKTITFETEMNPKENAKYSYDVSESKDGTVMSYLVPNPEENTKYDLYIQASGEIAANQNSSCFFANFISLESINGLEYLNTNNVTDFSNTFRSCKKLRFIDASNFDTSNVTTMYLMFYDCNNLSILDVSKFDTSNVTNMESTFRGCSNLSILDVSNFNTENVFYMDSIFANCSSLSLLDLSNFDTNRVTTMNSMFKGCSNLTTLNLSSFDTSSVTDMAGMFSGCSNLTTLNLSSFDTSNVTTMQSMFSMCSSLTELNIISFITSNVTTMNNMFDRCSNLTTLNLSSFDTSSVTDMTGMFSECSNLTTLNLSSFDTSSVTNMNNMFGRCSNLTTLNLSSFNTSNVTDMQRMFYMCSSLTILDVNTFDTSNVYYINEMFLGCAKLTATITIKGTKAYYYGSMFAGAATTSGAQITVNYTEDASTLVDRMINTKSSSSNVVKGNLVTV